jgi:DNA processing protein
MSEKLKYWIWLNSIPKVGAVKCKQLLNHFGQPENVWEASHAELKRLPFLSAQTADLIKDPRYKEEAILKLKTVNDLNINIITINDGLYPYYLKNIHDPPIILYVRGKMYNEEKCVAVVGSRKATSYGLKMAETISYELAKLGITVVSGMARGIDTYAHNGALRACGRTVAVLGCGLDIVYPSENKELMDKIIETGAVISEYPPGMQPVPGNFPARNRIISGISQGVVVIEAGERSGSLITAGFALDQGREVFAVPGNINSFTSVGTNKLIKDGAKIVTDIEDILEELKMFNFSGVNIGIEKKKAYDEARFKGLDSEERKLLEYLKMEPLHIDVLVKKSGMSVKVVNSILVMLELKGIIEQTPGKMFKIKE